MKSRLLDLTAGARRQDYREKLGRPAAHAAAEELVQELYPFAERMRALADGGDSTALQSLVVTALQTLGRVRQRQRLAMAASISLGQAEMLEGMVRATDAMVEALEERLSPQGRRMLQSCAPVDALPEEADGDRPSWWFALSEAIHALEDGVGRMAGLVAGQQKGSTARSLSSLVVRLMRQQHRLLLAEAEHWIG